MKGLLGRACYHPRCPNIVTEKGKKFCSAHHEEEKCEQRARGWRKKERNPFYVSVEWVKLRAIKFAMNPVCEHCHRKQTAEIDHITPLRIAPEMALDVDNLQGLCKSCHARKTQKESRDAIRNRRSE